MSIDLKSNYFDLFNVPISFDLDKTALSSAFRHIQLQVHPDKFANSSEQESRLAVQITAHVNEAYDTLRHARLRARYLLQLKGIEFNDETEISRDTDYLMAQLELRESINNVSSLDDGDEALELLDGLLQQVNRRQQKIEQNFRESYLNEAWDQAKIAVVKMRFCERVKSEISSIEEQIEDRI